MFAPASRRAAPRRRLRGGADGSDDVESQVSVCAFHHWCIHAGWLRVYGRAPDGLRWFLRGERWMGPPTP